MNYASAADYRKDVREKSVEIHTGKLLSGYEQANVVILPKAFLEDFLKFCEKNPKPCPLLEVVKGFEIQKMAKADIRTDVAKYHVYKDGNLMAKPNNITTYWENDFITFLIGCSYTFDWKLSRSCIPLRHHEGNKIVPMYYTKIKCSPSGTFEGNMVVSMRPLTSPQTTKAIALTSQWPNHHGAPVHVGAPEKIGINDINKPDLGDAVEIREGEQPVFWACGVTPQLIALQSKIPIMITHAPGYMFVGDRKLG